MSLKPYFIFRLQKQNNDFLKKIISYIETYVKPYFEYKIFFNDKKFIYQQIPVSSEDYDIYSFYDTETLKLSFNLLQKFESDNNICNILILPNKTSIFDGINTRDIDENFIIFHNLKILYLEKDEKVHNYDLIVKENDYIFDINSIKTC